MPRKDGTIPIWWTIFANEYIRNGNNGTLAYLVARPMVMESTAQVESSKLLGTPIFQAFFDEIRSKVVNEIGMSRKEWMDLLKDCARFDIRKYLKTESGSGDTQLVDDWETKPDGHVFESLEFATTTQESGAVVQRVKVKAASKLEALKVIGKAQGFLEEQSTSGVSSSDVLALLMKISQLAPEQKAKLNLPDPRIVDIEIEE